MYCPRWDWVAVLVVQLCLVGCSADYFWDGTEWRWQVSAGLQLKIIIFIDVQYM